MTSGQHSNCAVQWKVRICLTAFRDLQALIPRLAGRAELRRQALKLQWWNKEDVKIFDVLCGPISQVPMWELWIEEGYGFGNGFRAIFTPIEPDNTIWVLGIMRLEEPVTEVMKKIFQARLNAVIERKDVSHENPFGNT